MKFSATGCRSPQAHPPRLLHRGRQSTAAKETRPTRSQEGVNPGKGHINGLIYIYHEYND